MPLSFKCCMSEVYPMHEYRRLLCLLRMTFVAFFVSHFFKNTLMVSVKLREPSFS